MNLLDHAYDEILFLYFVRFHCLVILQDLACWRISESSCRMVRVAPE